MAPRNTLLADGQTTAFIDWDGIFVSTRIWVPAYAVWQFAPVCGDAYRWLDGWPSPPDRSAPKSPSQLLEPGCRSSASVSVPRIVSNSDGVTTGGDCFSYFKRSLSLLTMKSAPCSLASVTR